MDRVRLPTLEVCITRASRVGVAVLARVMHHREHSWQSRASIPRTGETRAKYQPLDLAALERKLDLAAQAFPEFSAEPVFRAKDSCSCGASELLEAEKRSLGRLMSEEMGKTLVSAVAEVEKCARACRHYAEHGEAALADEPIETEGARSFVRYLPLGTVLAVMPWNFPFWQVFRFMAPNLTAGNTMLLKHASNVAALRARDRGPPATCRAPGGRLSDPLDRLRSRAARAGRSARRRGHPDREHPGGLCGRRTGGQAHQAHGARARRQRRVHRHALGQSSTPRSAPRSSRARSTTANRASTRSDSSCTRTFTIASRPAW